jgi:hypothetical protein
MHKFAKYFNYIEIMEFFADEQHLFADAPKRRLSMTDGQIYFGREDGTRRSKDEK